MNKLYRFEVNYGRHGSLEGLFVATEYELNLLNNSTVNFGEALGKHSEVCLDEFKWQECCTVVSDDEEKIKWLVSILGYSVSGYNPLEYFYLEENYEYREGYEAESTDECEYEDGSPEKLRWIAGYNDKMSGNNED